MKGAEKIVLFNFTKFDFNYDDWLFSSLALNIIRYLSAYLFLYMCEANTYL